MFGSWNKDHQIDVDISLSGLVAGKQIEFSLLANGNFQLTAKVGPYPLYLILSSLSFINQLTSILQVDLIGTSLSSVLGYGLFILLFRWCTSPQGKKEYEETWLAALWYMTIFCSFFVMLEDILSIWTWLTDLLNPTSIAVLKVLFP